MSDSSWAWPAFIVWTGFACLCFIILMSVRAPYGRHQQAGWGPTLPARPAWVVMEACSLLVIVGLFLISNATGTLALTGLGLWAFHYSYRSFIYPLRARLKSKTMPILVTGLAVLFNIVNATFNGVALFFWHPEATNSLVLSVITLTGFFLFGLGFCIHVHSDQVLSALRASGTSRAGDYQIPEKGLHRWVASPNYLGELIQWLGFALLVHNLAAWSFFIWTAANLIPRAIANRAWYASHFPDYHRRRKTLVPFVF